MGWPFGKKETPQVAQNDPRAIAQDATIRASAQAEYARGYEDARNNKFDPPRGPTGIRNPFRIAPTTVNGQPRSVRHGEGGTPEQQAKNESYSTGWGDGQKTVPLWKRKYL